jgi:DNA-directed RNA polymerase subunit H (RpoH/RPB5)
LLDVLAAMNGKPEAEQKRLLEQLQLKPMALPK